MKVAVYNRYWDSRGGGERYSAAMAETLVKLGHSVELLSPVGVDVGALARHLSLDLAGVGVRELPGADEWAFEKISGQYDLFINGTYMSTAVSNAKKSIYVCYFPTPAYQNEPLWRRGLITRFGGLANRDAAYRVGDGWHLPEEGGRRLRWLWTNGRGVLELAPGQEVSATLHLGRPGATEPVQATIVAWDGSVLAEVRVGAAFAPVRLTIPASARRRKIRIVSATWKPAEDHRKLGVAWRRAGGVTHAAISTLLPGIRSMAPDQTFLESYDTILGISHYTQDWIRRTWGKESELLFPPVSVKAMTPSPVRDKSIVAIGRFFDPDRGHSKRQLEMVEIFRRARQDGHLDGWVLHLIGGVEPGNRPYYEQVMAAAEGLPVEFHPNATRGKLESIVNRASIFWSATGLHENTESHPWRNEHFGLTTAEAMAAGCVPVVIDRAGQREIVRHGIDGFRWTDVVEAVRFTREVAEDEALRDRMALSSQARANDFSDEAFAARLREIGAERGLFSRARPRRSGTAAPGLARTVD